MLVRTNLKEQQSKKTYKIEEQPWTKKTNPGFKYNHNITKNINVDQLQDSNSLTEEGVKTTEKEKKLSVIEKHGYILDNIIGEGTYANVKLAHSYRHNCNVAIKIISKHRVPKEYINKFLPREIAVLKGLKHNNITRFFQAIETTQRLYLIMEYAPNGTLLDMIRKEKYIKENIARQWFIQLTNAIEYCHNHHVVHRDIKCENLLLDQDYNLKVSDFGFAKHFRIDDSISDSRNISYGKYYGISTRKYEPLSDTYCGSYAYLCPEVLKGTLYYPTQSDIWSMGIVLYAMLYGALPFDDSNYGILIKQVQTKISFPTEPKVSDQCKSLMLSILVNAKVRININQIKQDPWFNTTEQKGLLINTNSSLMNMFEQYLKNYITTPSSSSSEEDLSDY